MRKLPFGLECTGLLFLLAAGCGSNGDKGLSGSGGDDGGIPPVPALDAGGDDASVPDPGIFSSPDAAMTPVTGLDASVPTPDSGMADAGTLDAADDHSAPVSTDDGGGAP